MKSISVIAAMLGSLVGCSVTSREPSQMGQQIVSDGSQTIAQLKARIAELERRQERSEFAILAVNRRAADALASVRSTQEQPALAQLVEPSGRDVESQRQADPSSNLEPNADNGAQPRANPRIAVSPAHTLSEKFAPWLRGAQRDDRPSDVQSPTQRAPAEEQQQLMLKVSYPRRVESGSSASAETSRIAPERTAAPTPASVVVPAQPSTAGVSASRTASTVAPPPNALASRARARRHQAAPMSNADGAPGAWSRVRPGDLSAN